jgi:hypothetical protein
MDSLRSSFEGERRGALWRGAGERRLSLAEELDRTYSRAVAGSWKGK